MKVGFYTENTPEMIGGGYVLRESLAIAATRIVGQHQFEMVGVPPHKTQLLRLGRRLQRDWRFWRGRPHGQVEQITMRLKEEVSLRKFDLLWFNQFAPLHCGVPYIFSVFDMQHRLQPWFPEVSENGEWELREGIWSVAVQRAARVTVGSHEAKEQLCHFYGLPKEKVWVIPFPTPHNAIELAKERVETVAPSNIREKYGIKHDILFYPAQFWPHKNHINLLHALKILVETEDRKLSLVLTGSDQGNLAHVKQVAADLGVSQRVHFCGFVSYEEVLALYREAKALCYVSLFGPENLPPLEAMALGCPVVLTDTPGIRDLTGDGPILVNATDPKSIADGIAKSLDDPEDVRRRIELGRIAAIRNDSDRYLATFQEMLDDFANIRRCWP